MGGAGPACALFVAAPGLPRGSTVDAGLVLLEGIITTTASAMGRARRGQGAQATVLAAFH